MVTNEIIRYQANELTHHIEVKIEDETVWLSQLQMVDLFQSTKQNISLHINNIFKEKELKQVSVVKEYLTVQIEGKRKVSRKVKYYNLDVIISVGYRVKSKTGTQFRIWANNVLKEYLIKGHVVNNRIENLEKKVNAIEIKNKEFELIIQSNLPPSQGVFYDGQIFDAYAFVSKIIKTAKKNIILLDNYIDESVLTLLSKSNKGVKIIIYTNKSTAQIKLDIDRFHKQYDPIELKEFTKSHDRFLIIDEIEIYHLGASLKDLGKKWFAFSKLNMDPSLIIEKL
ncbi:MAG: RhuM family protein [Flavobacterium sp.]